MLNCATSDTTLCLHCFQTHTKEISVHSFGITWFHVGLHFKLYNVYCMFCLTWILFCFHSDDFILICAICVSHNFTSFISTVAFHLLPVYTVPPVSVCLFVFFCLESFHHLPSIFPSVSSHFMVFFFPVFPPPHVASCVHCMWAPISGPPVLWARWSRLLWETLRHGEGMKVQPGVDCCPMSHSSLPPYKGYTDIRSPVSV